ncbi:MAG TPA: hypothetical protein VFI30_07325 [Nocardioidaceae bacterium]|nr:hypothetical protein [Nocardioidaceae bacterium]
MTPTPHPELDRLADLAEGLATPDDVAVQEHLNGCAQCRDSLASLTAVGTTLAAAARAVPSMPADLAERLEVALAAVAAERAAGVTALGHRRTALDQPARHRILTGLAAAAAALVIAAAALGGYRIAGQSGSSNTAAGEAAQTAGNARSPLAGRYSASGGVPGSRAARAPAPLTRAQLAALARRLAAGRDQPLAPGGQCAAPRLTRMATGFRPEATPAPVASILRWRGGRAVLVVNRLARTAAVFDCATGRQLGPVSSW